jgi:cobyric acid synthase CobQ/L-threonine-O-3-phosphate decarboxylase
LGAELKHFEHGGNLRQLAKVAGLQELEILDFSANINPLGPPEWLRPLISSQISALAHYPDPDCIALREAVAARYGVIVDEVIVGNGSTEILHLLTRTLAGARALIPVPSYLDYARAASLAGMHVETMPLEEDLDRHPYVDDSVVFLGRPNNPTGTVMAADTLRAIASRHSSSIFVVDEAFGDFVEGFESLTLRRPGNVAVLLSLTKIFAIPGLRLGCAVADPGLIQRMHDLQPTWSVNTLAQAVGVAALSDAEYVRSTREYVRLQRESFMAELCALPDLTVLPGQANFLMIKIEREGIDAPLLARKLLSAGIAIRVCDNFDGLDARFFRIAVRTERENARLVEELRHVLGRPRPVSQKRWARAIMFQGTSSNAGKSVMAAALCRILHQDGCRVAPFKSQNMSLNSFVTRDGREMGRAQVVQAQACRIEPDARMNPILLKPNSDTGSQVILLGKPVGNMDVTTYIRFKPQAFEVAKKAYDELATEHDVIVLEGAGSPAEVNLKHHDIANMQMARHAEAPVLVVGDIDRGGVFASFVGTMEVLAEWERALVAGFVVNRFRGQASLLKDALEYTERHTGRPVIGVIPFLSHLGLPEEDSVTFKEERASCAPEAAIDIAIVDLPHISNFTDFDALRIEPDVHLRIVRTAEELGQPDAVILPGSKNVVSDLLYLTQNGLAAAITGLERTEIVGICGGYQMLGSRIADPQGVESISKTTCGLGLLALSTVLASEKTLKRVSARHRDSGLAVHGYEIHHGQSVPTDHLQASIFSDDGEVIGMASSNCTIWGTYLHGIFEADDFRRWFIDRLRIRRGFPALGKVVAIYDLQESFDQLAATVRQSLNMEEIYRLLRL